MPPFRDAVVRAPRPFGATAAEEALTSVAPPTELEALIAGAGGCAPFLLRTMRREAEWLATLWDRPIAAAFDEIIGDVRAAAADGSGGAEPRGAFGVTLRVTRRRAALLIALADLGGVWDVDAATGALTRFADAACAAAVARLLAEEAARGAIPGLTDAAALSGAGYVVLAMGKMGAHELNYSSDIDLIALFDPDALPPKATPIVKERYVRLTQRFVKLLSEPTEEGYVARVDLRLRPDPGATPVCLSMPAAERYYEALARTWERAAHIKARVVAGDLAAGRAYLQRLGPFVWRRHLDFAAIEDAADMLARIRAYEGGGEVAVVGQDVKLGAGGIREIELLAQTRQLVLGGRDPKLRAARTRDALKALAAAGRLDPADRQRLDAAYLHLRTVEHRLQMLEDQQTHRVPHKPEELARLAAFMGTDWPALEAETKAHMEAVRQVAGPDLDQRPAASARPLESVRRLPDPTRAEAVARGWFSGQLRAVRSPRARAALERMTPDILARLAEASDPMQALMRFDQFLMGLPSGVQILALFESNPRLLDLLIEICAAAPRLAQHLAHRSSVLDAVLDADFFAPPAPLSERLAEATRLLSAASDYERTLDAARRWAAERRFQIGVGLLRGAIAPVDAGPAYADVAEACLAALTPYILAEHAERHGPPPGRGAAILAMGRLGSREMTATSDLDLIIVYDAAPTEESNGPKPLAASQYFMRFTQKLTTALTAPTAEGALYEVDMRLRPSGRAGPLATSLDAFARYQREDAWVWEHLALTRARVVGGEADLASAIEAAVRDALLRPRAADEMRAAAAAMRAKLRATQPEMSGAASSMWNLKHAPGGLFDIEFLAQTKLLIAREAGAGGFSTLAALEKLRESGDLSAEEAATLQEAHRLQAGLQQIERVALEGRFAREAAGPGVRAAFLRAAGAAEMGALETQLSTAQRRSATLYARHVDHSLGFDDGKLAPGK